MTDDDGIFVYREAADERVIVYRETAKLLRKKGWMQGAPYNGAGNQCLVYTVDCILRRLGQGGLEGTMLDVASPLMEALGLAPSAYWATLLDWNDEPGRTADEVITLLEQTAEKLEADETITEATS
jgi:hypothetical protein